MHMQIRASMWGRFFIFIVRFFCFQKPGERRLLHWGVSLAGPNNRYCNPTTDLLIIIIILIFILILILSILSILIILITLIILIILIIFIILIILFVLIIVVINSFLLPSLSSSSIFFIVLVSNLINIKRLALFATCSRLWLAASPKSCVRPLLHSDFTLLFPLYDYHPTPALLAFVPPPWPQVCFSLF